MSWMISDYNISSILEDKARKVDMADKEKVVVMP
jgi:hypothetical protein